MTLPLLYEELAAVLARLGYDDDAALFHGSMCGALCRVRAEDFEAAAQLEESGLTVDQRGRAELARLTDQTLASLADSEMGFMPLLPPDDASLAERARGLGAWCEGFLHGLASNRARLDIENYSDEVREVVKDLTQFTRANFAGADEVEVEENAYAELVEYIRVGVQLVFVELHPRGGDTMRDRPTLH